MDRRRERSGRRERKSEWKKKAMVVPFTSFFQNSLPLPTTHKLIFTVHSDVFPTNIPRTFRRPPVFFFRLCRDKICSGCDIVKTDDDVPHPTRCGKVLVACCFSRIPSCFLLPLPRKSWVWNGGPWGSTNWQLRPTKTQKSPCRRWGEWEMDRSKMHHFLLLSLFSP